MDKKMQEAPTILINHLLEPPAKITGITRYLFALLEELLSNRSFRYVLATTWRHPDLPEAVRNTGIATVTRNFNASAPLNVMAQMAIIPRLMRETHATLEFNCNPIGCFWPFWRRVITVHDLYYELMPHDFPRRRRLGWRLLFPRSLDAASAIICVSQASRQQLTRLYPRSARKTVVIHEAGALGQHIAEAGAIGQPVEKPYGLFVGNISPNKNPAVLVEAVKLLENRGNLFPLYHIGRDELALLAEAQRRLELKHPIRLLGTVTDDVLAASYQEAHCLINTSLDEGFCLPILEAQARGVPVVCSDIPVLREVAGEGALFFNPTDPAALAEALFKVFTDERLHTAMTDRARKNAALFSWKRAATETETLFRNVLERKNPNAGRP
jgi:glycosyltransferase involved in cell wall biosynthesis